MDVGQVGFKKENEVYRVPVEKDKEIVRRLERTREDRNTDLAADRAARDAQERSAVRAIKQAEATAQKAAKAEQLRQKELRSYDSLMKPERMRSNQDNEDWNPEEDFM
eukprot:gnl/Hemi2/21116_TR7004_c0_g2_i1.p2 gnl/Hemi2/21116_TR7004_c0_g2~~gnl/Hemi2/21116_TR7004_c0_g2_i1.p2  ORF type:complete len:108 (+),score=15.62 gnl/Hemi2/21116_TR7004_c0_g2_i1:344-667(+)